MVVVDEIDLSKLMKLKDIIGVLKKANVTVSRPTFERWIKTGYFPPCSIRIGNSLRWTEDVFKDWLHKCVENAQKG